MQGAMHVEVEALCKSETRLPLLHDTHQNADVPAAGANCRAERSTCKCYVPHSRACKGWYATHHVNTLTAPCWRRCCSLTPGLLPNATTAKAKVCMGPQAPKPKSAATLPAMRLIFAAMHTQHKWCTKYKPTPLANWVPHAHSNTGTPTLWHPQQQHHPPHAFGIWCVNQVSWFEDTSSPAHAPQPPGVSEVGWRCTAAVKTTLHGPASYSPCTKPAPSQTLATPRENSPKCAACPSVHKPSCLATCQSISPRSLGNVWQQTPQVRGLPTSSNNKPCRLALCGTNTCRLALCDAPKAHTKPGCPLP